MTKLLLLLLQLYSSPIPHGIDINTKLIYTRIYTVQTYTHTAVQGKGASPDTSLLSTIRWSSWWSLSNGSKQHHHQRTNSQTSSNRPSPSSIAFEDVVAVGNNDDRRESHFGRLPIRADEGADMDSTDRCFLERGLTSGTDRLAASGTRIATRNLTNSDSCHDWTGE